MEDENGGLTAAARACACGGSGGGARCRCAAGAAAHSTNRNRRATTPRRATGRAPRRAASAGDGLHRAAAAAALFAQNPARRASPTPPTLIKILSTKFILVLRLDMFRVYLPAAAMLFSVGHRFVHVIE